MMFIFFQVWSDESNPIVFTLSVMMLIFFGSDESNSIYSVANWVDPIQMWWSQVSAKCLFVLLMVKHETHTPPSSHPALHYTPTSISLYKSTQNQPTNPTNTPTPYIPTLTLNAYPTHLNYPYKPTQSYIPTLKTLNGRHQCQWIFVSHDCLQ